MDYWELGFGLVGTFSGAIALVLSGLALKEARKSANLTAAGLNVAFALTPLGGFESAAATARSSIPSLGVINTGASTLRVHTLLIAAITHKWTDLPPGVGSTSMDANPKLSRLERSSEREPWSHPGAVDIFALENAIAVMEGETVTIFAHVEYSLDGSTLRRYPLSVSVTPGSVHE